MEQGLLFLPGLFRTIWSSLLSSTPIKVWNPVTTVFFFFSLCAGRCGLSSVTLIIYLRLKRSEWFSDLMAVLQVVKGGDKGSWFPKEALKSCSISSWGLSKEIFISGAKVEKFNWILHSKCVYAAWWQPAKGTVRHFQSSLRSLAKKKNMSFVINGSKVVSFALVSLDHGHPWMLPAVLETCSCSCPNVCYIHAFPLQIGLYLWAVLTSLPIGLVIWAPTLLQEEGIHMEVSTTWKWQHETGQGLWWMLAAQTPWALFHPSHYCLVLLYQETFKVDLANQYSSC